MNRLRIRFGLLAVCLALTASAAKARPPISSPLIPFCEIACCQQHQPTGTPCYEGTSLVFCGPPYAYFCSGV
jgi:hypothetical protein